MEKLSIFKVGGNVMEDSALLTLFVKKIAMFPGLKLLVHGGGKMASEMMWRMGIEPQMVGGRRITNAETLQVVTMVYAGWANKTLVALLQAQGCNALGLSGADGGWIKARKRSVKDIDYGFAGDIDSQNVNIDLLRHLLQMNCTPVCCAITHDGNGQLLNTNADTIAAVVAVAAAQHYEVSLVYCFEKPGVLTDVSDDSSVIAELGYAHYETLKASGAIAHGMIPKLDNAFYALQNGVKSVRIQKAEAINTHSGTSLLFSR